MKQLLIFGLIILSVSAAAQYPPGYTGVNQRYDWLAGKFRALHLPAGNGPAALQTGQWPGSGAVYIDTAGGDRGMYMYILGTWLKVADTTTSGNAWALTGNTGTNQAINFLGTTDTMALRLRLNNLKHGFIPPVDATVGLDSLLISQIYLGLEAGKKDTALRDGNIGIGNYALRNYSKVGSTVGANIAIGHMALHNYTGGSSEANIAIGWRAQARNISGIRNVAVGLDGLHNLTTGNRNTGLGSFAGEWTSTGSDNTFVGESSSRLNTIGTFNASVGNSAGYSLTGAVRTTAITNGGSGYTTATITFSAPDTNPFGFNPSIQATGTAIINAGAIIGITITEIGAGYTSATATITGDGTGATATATVVGGSANTALGSTAMYSNRTGYGNVGIGVQSGYGDNSDVNARRVIDSFNTYVGTYASALLANPQSVSIHKSTALGYNALVGASNSMVLGGTGADSVRVGIGTQIPDAKLHISGSIYHNANNDTAMGLRLTNTNPATISLSNKSLPIVYEARGWESSGGTSTRVNLEEYMQTESAAVYPFMRKKWVFNVPGTFSNEAMSVDLNGELRLRTRAASQANIIRFQDFDGSNRAALYMNNAFQRLSFDNGYSTGTPVTNFSLYGPTDGNQIRAQLTWRGIQTPYRIVAGSFVHDTSAVLQANSTTMGFLMPRMTTTQQNAIITPATGLQIYNTDSLKPAHYNGSAWVYLGASGGGGGSITLGAIGATPNANGATLTGSVLNLEPASTSFGGVVTTGTQSFAGTKSFAGSGGSLTISFPSPAPELQSTSDFYFKAENGSSLYFGQTSTIRMTIDPNGKVGIGTTSPSAKLELAAGSATANTAPLEFNSGTVETTARGGLIEYNGTHYLTKASGLRYATEGTIADFYTDVSNSGTGETDIYTYTTPASTLAADGEKIFFTYTLNLTDITATAQVKVYFGGTAIANTGALTVSATGAVIVQGWIVRTGSTTARASVNISSPTASTAVYTSQTDLTGLTLSSTNIVKVTAQAGGAGGGTGDCVGKSGTVSWRGSAAN